MYIEFIIIYIGIAVIIGLLIFDIILTMKNKAKDKSVTASKNFSQVQPKDAYKTTEINSNTGTAFCKNCYNQFSANQNVCPYCGTPRN